MNIQTAILEKEVEKLNQLAEKFSQHGLTEKAHSYKAEVNSLRTRLDELEMIDYWRLT